jgi:hypothetical protein
MTAVAPFATSGNFAAAVVEVALINHPMPFIAF